VTFVVFGCVFLTLCPHLALAQPINSTVDTLYVDSMSVAAGSFDVGDTIWVGVGLVNTFDVGAIVYRLTLPDTSRIVPYYVEDGGAFFVPARLVGRADTTVTAGDTVGFDLSAVIRTAATTNAISGLMVDFNAEAVIQTGRGTIFEIGFRPKAGITTGSSAVVRVQDGSGSIDEPRNQLSDFSGLIAVYPVLREGLISFGGVIIDGNQPPAITFSPTQTAYTIKQGETVTFDITATDPDTTNDQVTLSGTLPAGATLTPSNPTVGTVTVSGTFEWTPNFSQEGVFNAAFSASDNHGANTSRTVSITVEKQDIDILFTSSADNAAPVGGIPGKTGLLLPVDVLASRPIYGIQFDIVLDGSAFRVDSLVPTSKLDGFTVWDNIGANPDTIRVITFSVGGDSIPLGGMSTILNFALTVDSLAVPGRRPVTFINAVEQITPDPEVGTVAMVVQNGAMYVDRFGDVNLDTLINVGDMVGLTSYIIGEFALPPRNFDAADVNADAAANVIDLVAIINFVLGFAPFPIGPIPPFEDGEAELRLVYGGMEGENAVYYIDGYMPTDVAGMEFLLTYDYDKMAPFSVEKGSDASDLQFDSDYWAGRKTDRLTIVAWYTGPTKSIQPGDGRYVKIPVRFKEAWTDMANPPLKIERAVLSDPHAAKIPVKGFDEERVLPDAFILDQNYPNPFNPTTTISFTLSAASAAGRAVSLTVYNVLGQRVATLIDEPLSAGRYEIQWDGRNEAGQRVASGLYLYRLVAGEHHETRKMVLLK
jgi:hypothetical protein